MVPLRVDAEVHR